VVDRALFLFVRVVEKGFSLLYSCIG
jgi:hypothetical protein